MDLVEAYQKLHEVSNAICATCDPPFHCCEMAGCAQAVYWAKRYYSVELDKGPGALPYLSDHGCTVLPHLRPLCTIWLCAQGMRRATPEFFRWRDEVVRGEVRKFDAAAKVRKAIRG